MARFRKGMNVSWNWGSGKGHGKVSEVFTKDVERTIGGSRIKRKASREEPAYLVLQADGGRVLKSQSELGADR